MTLRTPLAKAAAAHGFTLISTETLPEIDGTAHLMTHDFSKAKLLFLKNDDDNKSFSIAFRTPPADNTGVFHILEHSVLNGSDRYPVKEPFVNLLKTSMQTFLNAMTFPDKTMYPVASTNEKDLLNLADVYLDAVFHPAIYRNPAVFQQEGWHYELPQVEEETSAINDAMSDPAQKLAGLSWNGVVYNEMKGALSDAESVLFDTLQQLLFPHTPYRFESGGTPEAIPTLTYEHYLEEHERHYRTDNSYIILYGNIDINEMLAFLDKRHLRPAAQAQHERDQKRGSALLPRDLPLQAPVCTRDFSQTMPTAPENACAAMGYVIGHARDRVRVAAVDILLDAIMGSNEAPLKRALLDADLAADADAYVADALQQPFAVIELRGIKPGKAGEFHRIVDETLHTLVSEGLDRTLVEASLSRAEFIMREGNFGIADGVALSMAALSGWLYDDELATAYLRYEEEFAFFRNHLDDGWFDELLRETFIESKHFAQAEIVPIDEDPALAERKRLAEAAAQLTEEDARRIREEQERLRIIQETPDAPEDVAKLPHLSVSDIADVADEPAYELISLHEMPCIRHSVSTHGISYAYRYFDLNCVTFEELPYVSLLSSLLGKMPTARHSAQELDTLINGKLGNLSFYQQVHEDETDPNKIRPVFAVGASALSSRTEYLGSLSQEILTETDFSDTERIRDILKQRKAAMENAFINAGHSAALGRLASYILPSGQVIDQLSGLSMYQFTSGLIDNFDTAAPSLPARLAELSQRIFCDENQTLSFAGSDDDYCCFAEHGAQLGYPNNSRPYETKPRSATPQTLVTPKPQALNEAFIVPTDVCFAATGFDCRLMEAHYRASWKVAARALNYDYLWNEVRVKGGAYGVGIQVRRGGALRFYSYRDPNLDRTMERFNQACEWLDGLKLDEAELEGYIVSTVASIDSPQKARAIVKRQDADVFAGRSWSDRMEARKQVLATTPQDLRSLAAVLRSAVQHDVRCVFGKRETIMASELPWTVIELMRE